MKIAANYRASIYGLSDVLYHKSYPFETTIRSQSEELSSREEREETI